MMGRRHSVLSGLGLLPLVVGLFTACAEGGDVVVPEGRSVQLALQTTFDGPTGVPPEFDVSTLDVELWNVRGDSLIGDQRVDLSDSQPGDTIRAPLSFNIPADLDVAVVELQLLTAENRATWSSTDTVPIVRDGSELRVEPLFEWIGPGAGAERLELRLGDTPLGNDAVVRVDPDGEVQFSVVGVDATGAEVPNTEQAVIWTSESTDIGEFVDGSGLWRSNGALGSTTVQARHGPLELSASARIQVQQGEPSRVLVTAESDEAAVGEELTVLAQVLDEDDQPLRGQNVLWRVTAGGGTVSASPPTDAQGFTQVQWTLGQTPGDQELEARAGESAIGTVSARALVGAPASVEVNPPGETLAVGQSREFTARVLDRFENEVSGAEVIWSSTNTDVVTVTSSGVARGVGPGTAGVVAASGSVADTATVAVEAVPRVPTTLRVVSGDGQTGPVGEALPSPIRVQLLDQDGEAMPNRGVSWTVTQGGGSVQPGSSTTNAEGIAEVAWTLGTTPGAQRLRATVERVDLSPLSASVTATATLGPPASVEVTPGSTAPPLEVGATRQYRARVEDAFGNEIPEPELTWSSTNTAVLTVSSSGVVRAVAPGRAGVVATAGAAADTAIVDVEAEPRVPTTLRVVSGDGQTGPVGEALPLPIRVQLLDQDGQALPDRGVSWTVTQGGGSVEPGSSTTNAEGIAEVDWTLGTTPGGQRLQATVERADLSPLTASATATATVGPPASVEITPGSAAPPLEVGATRQYRARVEDAFGNEVVGAAVRWESSSDIVTIDPSSGLATARLPGTATIRAVVIADESVFGEVGVTVEEIDLGRGFALDQFSLVPAGTFQMGDRAGIGEPEELPVHTVNITSAFYLQRTEVTQAQWREVMGSDPSFFSGCDLCPVERVSWNDIQEFLARLNRSIPGAEFRLPTEAEWEYAARAGTTGVYGGTGVLDEMGWYRDNSFDDDPRGPDGRSTHAVAGKLPNAFGLYDMHGNVWEWVQDWYSATYYSVSPTNDPPGPAEGTERVLRGGFFNSPDIRARAAGRGRLDPTTVNFRNGFRLVRRDR